LRENNFSVNAQVAQNKLYNSLNKNRVSACDIHPYYIPSAELVIFGSCMVEFSLAEDMQKRKKYERKKFFFWKNKVKSSWLSVVKCTVDLGKIDKNVI
jgi:hypothetical protein